MLAAQRDALVDAGRRLAAVGLVTGAAGNLSVAAGDHLVVTASGARLDDTTAADMVVIDRTGAVVEGTRPPTSEVPLHVAVYAATGCSAIAHVHGVASTAVSCVLDTLPAVHYACLELGGPVPVAAYATYGSAELAVNVAAVLGRDRRAALLQNHGSLAVGTDPDEACERLELLEWLCEVYARACAIGRPRVLGAEELAEVERRTRSRAGR